MKMLKLILLSAASFAIVACGGGGSPIDRDSLFPSNSYLAYANDKNANELIDFIFGYNTDSILPRTQKKVANTKRLTVLNFVFEKLKELHKPLNKSKRLTDYSEICDEGSVYKNAIDANRVELRYINCQQGDFIYNGTLREEKTPTKISDKYLTNFTIRDIYDSSSLIVKRGSSIVSQKLNDEEHKIILNIVTSQNGKSNGFRDSEFIFNETEQTMYQISGRIYINNLKEYVKYDSSYDMRYTPFVYADGTIVDGEARYIFRDALLDLTINNGEAYYEFK